jgi:hypothetical protein
MVNDKTCPDISKFKHYLKITNAGSIDFSQAHEKEISSISDAIKMRTSSFDLIFFLIPQQWDQGKGYDYTRTYFNEGFYGHLEQDPARLISNEGCNWFQPRNAFKWAENGIYESVTLSKEYDKFSSDEGSDIIIARQHFDLGVENINVDITDVVNKFITMELPNYGIGIAFSPMLEMTECEIEHYVGFLTNNTPSFFEPYVESIYDDVITDSRSNFVLDKPNKLYLYCNVGGNLTNLDEIPTCEVNGNKYEVKQFSEGIYYIDITLSKNDFKANTMLYDTWGNIKYQGVTLDDVELDFVVKTPSVHFNIGNTIEETQKVIPTISGIKENENIKRGDVRKVIIIPRVEYSKTMAELVDYMEARVYIKDGTRELDVLPYQRVNKTMNENYFLIDTNILLPQKYYIDVKVKYSQELIIHHNTLSFKITDDLNDKYN